MHRFSSPACCLLPYCPIALLPYSLIALLHCRSEPSTRGLRYSSRKAMSSELTSYTLEPGTLAEVIKTSGTVSRDIRKDDYGKLEGYWSTEIGPLNQVMHLWSYKDLNERARLRAELAKN